MMATPSGGKGYINEGSCTTTRGSSLNSGCALVKAAVCVSVSWICMCVGNMDTSTHLHTHTCVGTCTHACTMTRGSSLKSGCAVVKAVFVYE